MEAEINRLPDGTYLIQVSPEELNCVISKVGRGDELDDREIVIAREFELI